MSTVKDHRVPCGHVGLVLTYAGRPKLILRDHVPLNLQAYWAMKKKTTLARTSSKLSMVLQSSTSNTVINI